MASNQELTELMELDLGINLQNRRPTSREVFKWADFDLLPHSSTDTLLCEIYEWSGRNWRTTEDNLIGLIFNPAETPGIKSALEAVPKSIANVPDFEFTKEDVIGLGAKLPSLYNIEVKGDISKAKEFSIKVNGVTKSRITNIDAPGIQIKTNLLNFAEGKPKEYRRKIKSNFIVKALFYADSITIAYKKDANVDLSLGFDMSDVEVKANVDTESHKEYSLKYTGTQAPFAASFVKGKEF